MKKAIILALACILVAAAAPVWAAKTMPPFKAKDVDGKKVSFEDLAAENELMAFVFFGMDCGPCKNELVEVNKFADDYDGFAVVAVSTDTARTSSQVKPYVKGQGFKFAVLLDEDGELVRALGIPGNPYSFLVTAEGDIIWEHSGYRKGDEKKMKEEIEAFLGSAGECPPNASDPVED